MTVKELRKLIGKDIKFTANGWARIGEVLEVSGRNVRVGSMGSWDWYWIPDMQGIEEIATKQAEGANQGAEGEI